MYGNSVLESSAGMGIYMEFQALTIQDKAWITELLSYENSRSCDFDFANLLLWDCFYRKQALRIGDRLLLRVNRSPEVYYMWPVGRGDFVPAIEALKANAQCLNIPLRIFGLEPEHVKLLQEQYPDEFLVQPLPEH